MDLDFVSVHKHAKKELGQYPAILTEQTWSTTIHTVFKPACVFGTSNGLEVVRSKRHAKHESANTGQAKLVGIEPSLCFKDIQSLYSTLILDVILQVWKLLILSFWLVFYYYFILPSVCILPLVCSLRFTLTVWFKFFFCSKCLHISLLEQN